VGQIFESRKSCEIDPSKLCEGENIDVNMTNLLFFVEKILSAIVSSSLSCPRLMCRIFSLLSQAAVRRFPERHSIVQYTAVSGFIFLRFFAPAILSPRLFKLHSEIPSPVVTRTLTLISKTVQSMGNIGTLANKSGSHKEPYLVPLNEQIMDEGHVRDIKTYLTAIADPTGGQDVGLDDLAYREGFLVKRSQGRRKGPKGPKNFRRRYFVLTARSLTYAKARSEALLCEIPAPDLLAVERVDDQAFNMKFMFQLVQPGRILYLQARNSVELKEWLSALAGVCGCEGNRQDIFHSGAYVNSQWTCCGGLTDDPNMGCRSVTLAMQVLSGRGGIDLERELHKVYCMFLEGQASLVRLKGEATHSARRDSASLPLRVSNLCELLIFVKNLELSCTAQPEPPLGSKHAPYVCQMDEALVVR
jgi:Ras GTPase-activating protein 3